jgi:hypothetical protein
MEVFVVKLATAILFAVRWFGWAHEERSRRFIAAGAGRPGSSWFPRQVA